MLLLLPYWPILAVLVGLYGIGSAWAAILLYHLGLVIGIMLKPQVLKTPIKGWHAGWAAGGVIIGLSALPAVYLMLPLLSGLRFGETGAYLKLTLESTGLAGSKFWIFFAYFVTIHPVLEELGWREILAAPNRWIHRRDFEFAAYHMLVIHYFFPWQWLLFLAVFATLTVAGALWRYLRKQTGGLCVPVLSHIAGDLGTLLAVWLLMRYAS